jgi:hypothetical protein
MSIERYQICLDSLLQGGTTCKNPTIRWEGIGDVEISCPDNNCNCVEIQVPTDAETKCFSVYVDCEDCDKCPPKVITKCLCSNNDNCGPCEVCIDGWCVSRCPDKVCDETRNICVDCKGDTDCPGDKICNAGKCVCPPNLPYDDNGRCVKCFNKGDCPPCTECVDGNCIPKNCGTGICDPVTGDCAECKSSGDCTGVNQCCINGKCQCCSGFTYNPQTGQCVPNPNCTSDDKCPDCYICVDGECLPRICPTGYICINDRCEKTCECGSGPCSKTEACIQHNSTTCFCKECSGSCNNSGDCGFGCFCDNGQCKPNPCNATSCSSSIDCGQGCGCFNNQCIPCSSFDCTTNNSCNEIDGCKCQGNNCTDDPCSDTPCTNGADCGPGCGCLNGVCTSCEKLSCLGLTCANTLGCECIGPNCRDITKCSGGCFIASDCGPGCTCYGGECVPCEDFPCDDCERDGCECSNGKCQGDPNGNDCNENATITLTKNDSNCTLTGTAIFDQCCTCQDLEYIVEHKYIPAVAWPGPGPLPNGSQFDQYRFSYVQVTISLYQNGIKLSELPVENSDKYVGQFRLKINMTNKAPIIKVVNVDHNYSTPDTIVFEKIQLPAFANGYVASVEIPNQLTFMNQCIYEGKLLMESFSPFITIIVEDKLKSDSCRSPIFTWYRNNFPGFSEEHVISRKYVPLKAIPNNINLYEETIEHPLVVGGEYYKLEVDCACGDKSKMYGTCQVPSMLYFCRPTTITPTFSLCNKRITFPTNVTSCQANKNVVWELLVKTVAVPAYNSNPITVFPLTQPVNVNPLTKTFVVIPAGTTLNFDSPVTSILWRIKNDPCEDCHYEVEISPSTQCCSDAPTMTVTPSCANNGIQVFVESALSAPIANCTVCIYTNSTTQLPTVCSVTDQNGIALFSNLGNGTYWVDFQHGLTSCDPYDCVERYEMNLNCLNCPSKSVTANYNSLNQILTINLSSIDLANTYNYFVNGTAFTNGSVIALSNGFHELKVIETYPGGESCEYINPAFVVNNCTSTVIVTNYFWDGPTDELQVISIAGGIAPYSVTFDGVTYNGVGIGGINISTIGVSNGIKMLTITDSNGCSSQYNVNIDRCAEFEGNAVYGCLNLAIDLTFNNGVAPYTYEVKNSSNIVITSGITMNSNENYIHPSPLPNGVYTLFVMDANGCIDDDPFEISCVCNPSPTFDIRGVSLFPGSPGEYLVEVTIQSLTNLTAPLTVDVYSGSGCTLALDTPYQQIIPDPVPTYPIIGQFDFVQAADGTTASIKITDTYGCTVCRNLSIIP